MADLSNSRRISYKATYNQISGSAVVTSQGGGLPKLPHRAVEKAAFVQSLRISPEELPHIRETLTAVKREERAPDGARAKALDAIKRLVADHTATSTLNNAARFSKVDPSILVEVADALVQHRRKVASTSQKLLASIVSAQRSSATSPSTARPSAPRRADEGETQATTTRDGIPVRINVVATTPRSQPETPEPRQSRKPSPRR